MHAVRRKAYSVLIVFLASAGMRLAEGSMDTTALRCAIACGHAMGAEKGATCCPMGETGGASFRSCSRGHDFLTAPVAPVAMLLPLMARPESPHEFDFVHPAAVPFRRSAFLRSPDKVPLRAC
jgi:hypothetical protein